MTERLGRAYDLAVRGVACRALLLREGVVYGLLREQRHHLDVTAQALDVAKDGLLL
jgi:hypothetical protein